MFSPLRENVYVTSCAKIVFGLGNDVQSLFNHNISYKSQLIVLLCFLIDIFFTDAGCFLASPPPFTEWTRGKPSCEPW